MASATSSARSPGRINNGTAYARRKDWTVANEHVYVGDGISGAEFGR